MAAGGRARTPKWKMAPPGAPAARAPHADERAARGRPLTGAKLSFGRGRAPAWPRGRGAGERRPGPAGRDCGRASVCLRAQLRPAGLAAPPAIMGVGGRRAPGGRWPVNKSIAGGAGRQVAPRGPTTHQHHYLPQVRSDVALDVLERVAVPRAAGPHAAEYCSHLGRDRATLTFRLVWRPYWLRRRSSRPP